MDALNSGEKVTVRVQFHRHLIKGLLLFNGDDTGSLALGLFVPGHRLSGLQPLGIFAHAEAVQRGLLGPEGNIRLGRSPDGVSYPSIEPPWLSVLRGQRGQVDLLQIFLEVGNSLS
jgi:hypothetical protein